MTILSSVLSWKARLSLSRQILVLLCLLGSLFAVLSTLSNAYWDQQKNSERTEAILASVDTYFVPKIQRYLKVKDQLQLEVVVKELYRFAEVDGVKIAMSGSSDIQLGQFSSQYSVVSHWGLEEGSSDKTLSLALVSPNQIEWQDRFSYQEFATQSLLALMMVLLGYIILLNSIIKPIREMSRRVGEIDENNLPNKIHFESRWFQDELSQFNERYNNAVVRIRETFLQLSNTCQQAEIAKARKSDLMSTMSHEIRNSLNSYVGMVSLLKDEPSKEELKEFSALIQSATANLQDLVSDIHDMSQLETGRLDIVKKDFCITELVDDIDAMFRAKATEKDLLFQCTLDSSINPRLLGDKSRIRQVLRNLLSNAIKFTDSGYVLLDVQHLSYDDNSETILFEVKDSGVGIDLTQQDEVFEQNISSDSSERNTTGVRLGITRNLIHLMGGHLRLDSEPGVGTHFSFTLRFSHSSEQPVMIDDELDKPRALLLDDYCLNMRITSIQLDKMGWESTCCQDISYVTTMLKTALKKGLAYQLLVIDHDLAYLDSFDFVKQIKEGLGDKAPSIMMISSSKFDHKEAIKHGVDICLARPYDVDDLERKVKSVFEKEPLTPPPHLLVIKPTVKSLLRVLLVEDQVSNQVVMKKMLERLGVDVSVAENGRVAVSKCAVEHYDLVLMDCQMPVMDGFEATFSIRKMENESSLRVPIVALTANVLAEEKKRCFEVGMDGFVSKPVSLSKLSTVLRKHVSNFEFIVKDSKSNSESSELSKKRTTH
ncbi:response regulator [Vibrio penaeicida]|uniref:response regulator n=1 Tax=Vibrio penaeicida TaxID=104609 RepID=UPI00273721FD|nr:response regulator [Vibrio penaeicida]MDP2573366.1 response regulator [Vibrio penaeicida]